MNTFGRTIGLTIFGESHGLSIGAVLDGLPSGEAIDWDAVRAEMARRAPGKNKMSTARSEKDAFEVQSGFFNGHTTGTPLCAIIRNSDQHSRDYDQLRHIMRPGHADYSGKIRYGGFNDYRGGGHFSGRLTAPLVFAGAVASQILARHGITVGFECADKAGDDQVEYHGGDHGQCDLREHPETGSAVHSCCIVVHGVHTGESTGQDQDLKGHNDPDGVKAQHEHFRPVGSVDEIHGAAAEKLDQ